VTAGLARALPFLPHARRRARLEHGLLAASRHGREFRDRAVASC
jgi:hypothetical protein